MPSGPKTRLLELAQGAFLATHDNVLLIGPSGIGKTHLLMGLGRALCLAGYRVLFRPAVTQQATELGVAHKELRRPRLLAHYRRFDLVLVDELGYLPFAKQTAEVLFQFFSDRYERASVRITSNLVFAQWTQVFGQEQMTAALLDRLVYRSHILMVEGRAFAVARVYRSKKSRHDGLMRSEVAQNSLDVHKCYSRYSPAQYFRLYLVRATSILDAHDASEMGRFGVQITSENEAVLGRSQPVLGGQGASKAPLD